MRGSMSIDFAIAELRMKIQARRKRKIVMQAAAIALTATGICLAAKLCIASPISV